MNLSCFTHFLLFKAHSGSDFSFPYSKKKRTIYFQGYSDLFIGNVLFLIWSILPPVFFSSFWGITMNATKSLEHMKLR